MKRFSKIMSAILFFIFTAYSFAFSQGETITITTYYPSPYGSYRELRAQRMAIGDNYLNSAAYRWGTEINSNADLVVEGNVGIGTADPNRPLEVKGSVVDRHTAAFFDTVSNTGVGIGGLGGRGSLQAYDTGGTNVDLYLQTFGGQLIVGIADPLVPATSYKMLIKTSLAGLWVNTTGASYAGNFSGGLGLYASRIQAGSGATTDYLGTDAVSNVFDIAEDINAPGCEAGDVVVIDPSNDRTVVKSTTPYDMAIAGVISENPVFHIGKTEGYKPLALAGQVWVKVTTENGEIKRGDLLVTSSKPGHAMKADPAKLGFGMIIGKALEPFSGGQEGETEGKIVALVNLQ